MTIISSRAGVPGRGRGDSSGEEDEAGKGGRGEGAEEAGRRGGVDETGLVEASLHVHTIECLGNG